MRLSSGIEERKARIEIVPLIDVIFLLLVFFIYAMVTMTVQRGLRVALPSASGAPVSRESVVITLTASNTLLMDNRTVTLEEAVAAALAAPRAGQSVLLNADRAADLGPALELVSRLREGGVTSVAFLVRPEERP